MNNSRLRTKLQQGDFLRVVCINRVTDPWLVEVTGNLGFDLVWFDMEHRTFGYDVVGPLAVGCRASGCELMVRIRKTGYTSAMRVLEAGASAVMVPHCRSVAEAKEWVDWTRFPPCGKRGFDGAGADADYALAAPLEHLQSRNSQTLLVLQIEDKEAVEVVDDIARVEGVDLLFVGPADLSISYGVPMQFEHPLLQRAIDRVASAAAKAGKWWGTVTDSPDAAQRMLDRGARMVTCANDHWLLVHGLQQACRDFSRIAVRP